MILLNREKRIALKKKKSFEFTKLSPFSFIFFTLPPKYSASNRDFYHIESVIQAKGRKQKKLQLLLCSQTSPSSNLLLKQKIWNYCLKGLKMRLLSIDFTSSELFPFSRLLVSKSLAEYKLILVSWSCFQFCL